MLWGEIARNNGTRAVEVEKEEDIKKKGTTNLVNTKKKKKKIQPIAVCLFEQCLMVRMQVYFFCGSKGMQKKVVTRHRH
jgi:hypothetical protein